MNNHVDPVAILDDAAGAEFEKLDGSLFKLLTAEMGELDVAEECIHSNHHDLMELIHFDERQILHHLRRRYRSGVLYTEIGDILISFNPQKEIENLYGETLLTEYQLMIPQTAATFDPHIFKFAQRSFLKLLSSKESQSLILSGESGAGQTFNQHQALEYLLKTIPNAMESKSIETAIPMAISILECFGNAATERNPNASQFGIWIDLEIETANKLIVGCGFKEYLLATYRLLDFPMESPKERSFNILEILRDHIPGADESRYLPPPNAETAAAIPMTLDELKDGFDFLGCSMEDVDQIMNITKAIIQIGRLQLENGKFGGDLGILENIKECLGLNENGVEAFKQVVQHTEVFTTSRHMEIPSEQQQALEMLDKTARFLHFCLFRYLFVNFSFIFKRDSEIDPSNVSTIGICNFKGFEVNENGNDFQELMENWAAERLEELHFRDIVNDQLEVYEEEGVSSEGLMTQSAMEQMMESSWGVLRMLQRPEVGMMSIIDRHTVLWHSMDSDDDSLLQEFNESETAYSGYYKCNGNDGFIISHFGGDTKYDITDFIKKNDDSLPWKMVKTLLESERNTVLGEAVNLYVESMNMKEDDDVSGMTVTKHFGDELNDLVERIRSGDPHFIRCFRINDGSGSDHFDSKLVYKQMESAGIQHVLKVRNLGLPFRFGKSQFVERYIWLHPDIESRAKIAENRNLGSQELHEFQEVIDYNQLTEDILKTFWSEIGESNDIRLQNGKDHVFMTNLMYSELDRMRDHFMRKTLSAVVEFVRKTLTRKLIHAVSTKLKMLKLALRNGATEKIMKLLQGIKDLECSLDLKDVILEHHMVRKAAEMTEFDMPRGKAPTRESTPESVSNANVNEMKTVSGLSLAFRRDEYRTSIKILTDKLDEVVQDSAVSVCEIKKEYEWRIQELNAKIIKLREENEELNQKVNSGVPCLETDDDPRCAYELGKLRHMKEQLEDYKDGDPSDHIGLSHCSTLNAPTETLFELNDRDGEAKNDVDGNSVEPEVEAKQNGDGGDGENNADGRSQTKTEGENSLDKFKQLHIAVHSQLGDNLTALPIAQDVVRNQESFQEMFRKQERKEIIESGTEIPGMSQVVSDLDELNVTLRSWATLGDILSKEKSLLPGKVRVAPLMEHYLTHYAPEEVPGDAEPGPYEIKLRVLSAPKKDNCNIGPLVISSLESFSGNSSSFDQVPRQTDEVVDVRGNLLDQFDALGEEKEEKQHNPLDDFDGFGHSLPQSDGQTHEETEDSMLNVRRCMLLQDVDLVRNPDNETPQKVGELKATRILKVIKTQTFRERKFALLCDPDLDAKYNLAPSEGWILCQDEEGNPNVPLLHRMQTQAFTKKARRKKK